MTLLTLMLAALVAACVWAYRMARAREAMDAERKPVLRVNVRDFDNPREAVLSALDWRWGAPCHVCAARLTTEAHYIGGNRVVCPTCYEAMQKVAA